ncbi:VOC family protein [Sphingomonadaceae bacterium jetA1]|jgi:predicted enzyme related to lactoylglutathione lyase|uniref:VOC family protein n=1 Tax=Facivitalis istanbulensis TaxID=3075838 RepID=UPI003485D52B
MANFIWYELLTDDVATAQAFYSAVIGWQVGDSGIPDLDYRIVATAEGEAIGGLMQRPADAPGYPAWFGYLPVVDVDESLGTIVEDGGTVLKPAWTVPGVGRMALVADPLGAPFYVMAHEAERPSRAFAEYGSGAVVGHVVWNERIASDPDRALAFFARHFGWTHRGGMPMGELGEYRFLADGPVVLGAMMGCPPDGTPGWYFYVAVEDIDAAAGRVTDHGGTIEYGPVEIPGVGHALAARDPQGARFGLVGPRP